MFVERPYLTRTTDIVGTKALADPAQASNAATEENFILTRGEVEVTWELVVGAGVRGWKFAVGVSSVP